MFQEQTRFCNHFGLTASWSYCSAPPQNCCNCTLQTCHDRFLIFIGPCNVIYSYSTTNKMHLLSQIIYSCKTLYMFRTVFPSIIRSSKLRIQQRYMSKSCCYLLLATGSSSCLTYTVAVCAVLSSWWWTERPSQTFRVFYKNVCVCVGVLVICVLYSDWGFSVLFPQL
jgi:hypothetical protein